MAIPNLWIPAVKSAGIFEPLKFLAFTAPYDALLTDAQEVASPNLESSNQLFETLEEWNTQLERQCAGQHDIERP
jgi:hypothetical protein